jgi:integrase
LLASLRDELASHKASAKRTAPADYVFATSRGGRPSKDNLRSRVFDKAVERADENLEQDDRTPLPRGLTPHRLRHTCCSLLFAQGWELPRVMSFLGHADSQVTLRLYAHVMSHDAGERDALRALVEGGIVALNRHQAAESLTQEAA